MVFILLGTGFEEAEALVTCDVLRRGSLSVSLVSVTGEAAVTGAHGITVKTDDAAESVSVSESDTIVIPGGMGGVSSIKHSRAAMRLISDAADDGALLAAICAGPAVYAALGLLTDRKITCFPGCEELMDGAACDVSKNVLVDGQLITGRAPGAVFDFALSLLEQLTDRVTARQIRDDLVY